MNIAVILAGGSGSRVGFDIPKQFVEICGKPMIVHCIEVFQNHPEVDGIVLVCIKEYIDKMKELTSQYKLDKVRKIVNGGATFMDSCKNGVYSLVETCTEERRNCLGNGGHHITFISCIKLIKSTKIIAYSNAWYSTQSAFNSSTNSARV